MSSTAGPSNVHERAPSLRSNAACVANPDACLGGSPRPRTSTSSQPPPSSLPSSASTSLPFASESSSGSSLVGRHLYSAVTASGSANDVSSSCATGQWKERRAALAPPKRTSAAASVADAICVACARRVARIESSKKHAAPRVGGGGGGGGDWATGVSSLVAGSAGSAGSVGSERGSGCSLAGPCPT